ncbi:MAG: hypothetical protein NTV51_04055 [Verrucomicrobia bacterium]|nr:hypothetical protein [Verrucomicrobiota bacterium]
MGATGTTTVNFGAFPGSSDTSVAVTGQATILSGSLVEAWIFPTATADHTADEHWVEGIRVMAGNVSAGVGFTIYARIDGAIPEGLVQHGAVGDGGPVNSGLLSGTAGPLKGAGAPSIGGLAPRLYGQYTVAWVWV